MMPDRSFASPSIANRSFALLLVVSSTFAGPSLRKAVAQNLVLSEFQAVNATTLVDEDGYDSDWVEVQSLEANPVNMAGWYLTDDRGDLRKWQFPSVTIEGGGFLVVFASAKDRRTAGSELHTNFRLTSSGEYLALVAPDGTTIAHEYAPQYGPQYEDVSFGLAEDATVFSLVGEGAVARVHVPTSDGDGLDWTMPGFSDGSWQFAVNGIGFDTDGAVLPPPDQLVNLAPDGLASQSTDYSASFPAVRAIDLNFGNFTATAAADPSPTWEVDLGATHPIALIVVHNRGDGCCQERLRDITVSVLDATGTQTRYESPLLNPNNSSGNPIELRLDLVELTGASVEGRIVRVQRTPDPGGGGDDRAILSLGEVEVFEGVSGFGGLINTDLEASMHGVNASAYIRYPFALNDPGSLDRLRLRVRYDDGFVAYINGVEVARRNAPGGVGSPPGWSAGATAEHPDSEAVVFQEIDITEHLNALVPGDNVLAIHGLNRSASDGDFLITATLNGLAAVSIRERYFENPTPGAINDTRGLLGFVADTKFSVDRGVYDAAFDVEVTTATDGAQIRYTLDRSVPTATSGQVYSGPITIDSSTILRAAAFKTGFGPTNVDTQTYIFRDDVLAQSVILRDIADSATYGPEMPAALVAVPTVSLVTTASINPSSEVQTSFEFFLPDGSEGVQVDCGVKKVGGHSLGNYPKNNMRLYFRRAYGYSKLRYPLFDGLRYGGRTAESFDRLNLRAGSHDSVFYLGVNAQPPSNAQYLRNRWISDMQFEMGHMSLNGRFVQVYVNGVYAGHHHLLEHPTRDYMASYMGGEKEQYDTFNSGSRPVGDSSLATWNHIRNVTGNYPEFQRYVDVQNYVDYMVLNFYAGNDWDWSPGQNWMAGGPSAPDSGGYKFFAWDSDIIFRRINDHNLNRGGPGGIFSGLLAHGEFRTLLKDRIFEHLFNDGCLTPSRVSTRYSFRAEQIRTSIVAETARWRWGGVTWTRDNQWQSELNRLSTQFFPQRPGVVLDQLRNAGWYPDFQPPTFRINGALHHGDRRVEAGDVLRMEFDGGTSSSQLRLVDRQSSVTAYVPQDDSLGEDWRVGSFVEGAAGETWRSGGNGVGYDTSAGYRDAIEIDTIGEMRGDGGNNSVYVRLPFVVDSQATLESFEGLMLEVVYDDGFVAYLNGVEVARANSPATVTWNSAALSGLEADVNNPTRFDVSGFMNELVVGDNLLAIHGMNVSTGSSDMLIIGLLSADVPEDMNPAPSDNIFYTLDGTDPVDGGIQYAGPITLTETIEVNARSRDGGEWSALHSGLLYLDVPLRITEVMYHPRDPEEGSPYADDDFEFLEFQNVGAASIDLNGFRLGGGIEFDFVDVPPLGPGSVLVVAKHEVGFLRRYPLGNINLIGGYSGRLGNSGDRVVLYGRLGEPILDFEYSDTWYPETDGLGHSLVIIDPQAPPDTWGVAASWRPSDDVDGTPGVVEPDATGGWQLPGDVNQDGGLDISDAVNLLLRLFAGVNQAPPCDGDSIAGGSNLVLADINGDGGVDVSDPVGLLNYLFASGPGPALGTACVRIEGCPDVCR